MPSQQSSQGFSLLEMTVVLLVLALLMGGMLMPLRTQFEYQKQQQTAKSLTEIKEALIGYAIIHGRLPCPTFITDPAHADFGVEATSCAAAVASDGYLPWKSLGVNETDAWGIRQTAASAGMVGYWRYRVDTKFSSTFKFDTTFSSSELRVIDNAGTRITTAAEAPMAVVYSTGKNLRADGENADYEATGGVYQSDVQSKTFDDMLIWITRPLLMYRMVSAGKLPS
ncbi:MAG: prepilin-type N-terminal cleavage/methylation domain-containing protein [Methylotenera sp.]